MGSSRAGSNPADNGTIFILNETSVCEYRDRMQEQVRAIAYARSWGVEVVPKRPVELIQSDNRSEIMLFC